MSSHYNLKQEKCWSCESYCGNKRKKNGLMFGLNIETSDSGFCSKHNKNVNENYSCSKYRRDGLTSSLIGINDNQREQDRQNRYYEEQNKKYEYESQKAKEELEEARKNLERERKRLEYERWYHSLTDEEKRIEDDRIRRIKAEKEAKEVEFQRIKQETATSYERLQKVTKPAKKMRNAEVVLLILSIVCFYLLNSTLNEVLFEESSSFILYELSFYLLPAFSIIIWLIIALSKIGKKATKIFMFVFIPIIYLIGLSLNLIMISSFEYEVAKLIFIISTIIFSILLLVDIVIRIKRSIYLKSDAYKDALNEYLKLTKKEIEIINER